MPSPTRTAHPEDTDPLIAAFAPFGLQVDAGRVRMRLLRDSDFPAYAALLREPIFADENADHVFGWYRVEPEQRVTQALQFQWSLRAQVSPQSWTLPLGVFVDGRLVGCQDVAARDFARRGVVTSGSWLTLAAQGQGLGSLMRRAMLVLAFDHLGARRAESAAVLGNERSAAVSHACGYAEDGTKVAVDGDRVVTHQRYLVTPDTFRRAEVTVQVTGLDERLRTMLGA